MSKYNGEGFSNSGEYKMVNLLPYLSKIAGSLKKLEDVNKNLTHSQLKEYDHADLSVRLEYVEKIMECYEEAQGMIEQYKGSAAVTSDFMAFMSLYFKVKAKLINQIAEVRRTDFNQQSSTLRQTSLSEAPNSQAPLWKMKVPKIQLPKLNGLTQIRAENEKDETPTKNIDLDLGSFKEDFQTDPMQSQPQSQNQQNLQLVQMPRNHNLQQNLQQQSQQILQHRLQQQQHLLINQQTNVPQNSHQQQQQQQFNITSNQQQQEQFSLQKQQQQQNLTNSLSSTSVSTSNSNSKQTTSQHKQFLINPLTGELEPSPSDDSDTEAEQETQTNSALHNLTNATTTSQGSIYTPNNSTNSIYDLLPNSTMHFSEDSNSNSCSTAFSKLSTAEQNNGGSLTPQQLGAGSDTERSRDSFISNKSQKIKSKSKSNVSTCGNLNANTSLVNSKPGDMGSPRSNTSYPSVAAMLAGGNHSNKKSKTNLLREKIQQGVREKKSKEAANAGVVKPKRERAKAGSKSKAAIAAAASTQTQNKQNSTIGNSSTTTLSLTNTTISINSTNAIIKTSDAGNPYTQEQQTTSTVSTTAVPHQFQHQQSQQTSTTDSVQQHTQSSISTASSIVANIAATVAATANTFKSQQQYLQGFANKKHSLSNQGHSTTSNVSNTSSSQHITETASTAPAINLAPPVTIKHNNHKKYIWESDASSLSIVENPRGDTFKRVSIISLHLENESQDFLEEDTSRKLIQVPVEEQKLVTKKPTDDEIIDEDEDAKVKEDTSADDTPKTKKVSEAVWDSMLINNSKPIWTCKPNEGIEEEYNEFYKSLTKDSSEPPMRIHFIAEGKVTFKGLLYIPKVQQSEFFNRYYTKSDNIKLFVRRIFITNKLNGMMPNYLNFICVMVNSDDLPQVCEQHLKFDDRINVTKTLGVVWDPRCAEDPNEFEVLTRGHFLMEGPLISTTEPDIVDMDINRLSTWQKLLQMQKIIWNRSYLSSLQERSKWHVKVNNINEDGVVRLAVIRTSNGLAKHAMSKLAVSPVIHVLKAVAFQRGEDVKF